uniref:hypothetical protein n=1 Tax=Escherichia coli TaxID=562 RepID=UPI001953BA3A
EFIPGLSAVQIASLREFSIAVALIIIIQLRPQGMFGPRNERSGARAPVPTPARIAQGKLGTIP